MVLWGYQISTYVFFFKMEKLCSSGCGQKDRKRRNTRRGWRKQCREVYGYKSVTNLLKLLKLITKDKIIFVRQNIDYLTGNKIHLTIILYCTTFLSFGKCCREVTFLSRRRFVKWKALINYFKDKKKPYSSIYLFPYR